MELAFTVPGAPVPKARPRVYAGRVITEPRTVAYESLVRLHALQACQEAKRAGVDWHADHLNYEVHVDFYMPTARRPDVDNLLKACLDAMNGIVYDDDSAVWRVEASRAQAGDPGRARAEIHVFAQGQRKPPAKAKRRRQEAA